MCVRMCASVREREPECLRHTMHGCQMNDEQIYYAKIVTRATQATAVQKTNWGNEHCRAKMQHWYAQAGGVPMSS